MLDDQDLAAAPDAADDSAVSNPAASNDAPPTDDPYGLRGLTFADLPSQPGDGVFGGVMRQMAANGHPGLQGWAANEGVGNSAVPKIPATAGPTTAPSYNLAPGITISSALGAKAEPIAATVSDAIGSPMTITSTIRNPAGQAAAMFNNLEKGTPASYANKAAAQQITDAYNQAKSDGKSLPTPSPPCSLKSLSR